jgi:hypothetical protein
LAQELRAYENALSQCLVDLAEDPANEDLRKEREESSGRAARLRLELADLERARAHAQRLDAGLERDTKLDLCAAKAEEAKTLIQKRIDVAGNVMKTIQTLIDQKKAYDDLDEQCHNAFCAALRPLVDPQRFFQQGDLQGGRLIIPLFDELMRTVVLHAHQQQPLDAANWHAAYKADALDRELGRATAVEASA